MFIIYCLELLLLVYFVPALAVFPKLILSSRTIVAIPFISIGIIVLSQWMLVAIDSYSHLNVTSLSVGMFLIAIFRLILIFRERGKLVFFWPKTHCLLLIFCLMLGIFWAGDLGSTSFDRDDEIYSWNMWAIQHYQNIPIDFSFTGAPYPQLFPILISYCYKLLGSVELQLPVKAMFAIFPVALWGAIAVAPKEATEANAIKSVFVMFLMCWAAGKLFGIGYADTLMVSSLVIAIYLFVQYQSNPERTDLLVFSIICAIVAFYTKQAGLIWALFSMPVISIVAISKRRLPLSVMVGALPLLTLALIWIIGDGQGFQNNHGVIEASQHGRSVFEQILFSLKKYIIEEPLVLLFVIFGIYSALKSRRHVDILVLFLLPSLIAWLLYGAYSLRLGLHVLAVSVLLTALCNYSFPASLGGGDWPKLQLFVRRNFLIIAITVPLIIISVTLHKIKKHLEIYDDQFSLYIAGKNTIARYFGSGADFVFKNIYDKPDLLLWVPTHYIYGIFYSHTPMIKPNFSKLYDAHMLLEEIKISRPNYLFDAGEIYKSPKSLILRDLAITQCPFLFERLNGENKYSYIIYSLHDDIALIEQCNTVLNNNKSTSL